MFVYLDNSATTRQHDDVTELMVTMMKEEFGNPSSLHRLGVTAEKRLKTARKQVATSMGVREDEIYFTSGGTESDNTAIFGAFEARKRSGNKVITSQIEHPAVLEACRRLERQGGQVVYLNVDKSGKVDLEQLERELDQHTVLISIMHVNNELGTLQPLEEIGRLKRQAEKKWGKGLLFHTDAVQSYGKEELEPAKWSADLISVSGHKIHGPKGIGALYIHGGLHLPPFLYGGGQERAFRSGTENMPAIAGLGLAADLASKDRRQRTAQLWELRERLKNKITETVGDIRINGPEGPAGEGRQGSPAILNVSFLGCRSEVLLHELEQREIYVSTGSACSSHKKGSHVLAAAGLSPQEIEGAIRFSLSAFNTAEQIDFAATELAAAVERQRKLRSAFGKNKR